MTQAPPDPGSGWSGPPGQRLGLFAATGVELEYMIVDRETLDVRPVADRLFEAAAGAPVSELEPDGPAGAIAWSNELALHVVELKTARPAPILEPLPDAFQDHVRRIDALLGPMGCRLLPTGMHPWMAPDVETRLWPHEQNEIYRAYDRVFGCRGHGWSNLQSAHINLPFATDEEFARLHAAIRLVLPLLPALAASSPIIGGKWTPVADNRMEVYRLNSTRVPMMAGLVIPEPVFSRRAYETEILGRLYDQLAPLDPAGTLRHEWANARGAIARFDRSSIEIRVLDTQERPLADLAIAALVTRVVRALVEQRWIDHDAQRRVPTEPLHETLLDTIRSAERTRIRARPLLEAFGIPRSLAWAGDVWAHLLEAVMPDDPVWTEPIGGILAHGTLATRITRTMRRFPTRAELHETYAELADCLAAGAPFRMG